MIQATPELAFFADFLRDFADLIERSSEGKLSPREEKYCLQGFSDLAAWAQALFLEHNQHSDAETSPFFLNENTNSRENYHVGT